MRTQSLPSGDSLTAVRWSDNKVYIVTCEADGTIPINSKIVMVLSTNDLPDEWLRLILAAPQLLRACRDLDRRARGTGFASVAEVEPYISAIRAAIAKAEH